MSFPADIQPWLLEEILEYQARQTPPERPQASAERHPSHLPADTPGDWVRANLHWEDYLQRHGWQQMRGGYWCRPGKNPRDGHSAQLHEDGRLAIWTGEVPDEVRDLGSVQTDGGISISLYDFIAAYEFGGDRAAFGGHVRLRLMPPSPPVPGWESTGQGANGPGTDEGSDDDAETSWFNPVDLTGVLDGTEVQAAPTILCRTDGVGLFYPGTINGIHGESGLGKGWVAVTACAEMVKAGETVIYVDLEDTPTSITSRLRCVGLTREQIKANLLYIRPQDRTSAVAIARLVQLVKDRGVSLVIIDSLGEAFGLDSINEDKDNEVGPWLRQVPRALADAGACVVIVDHVTKSVENPLYPKGSARKRAAVGGASYHVEALQPMTKGKGGKLRLTCAKDRYGFHARGHAAAEMVFTASGPDDLLVTIYPVGLVDNATTEQDRHERKIEEKALVMLQVARTLRQAVSKTELCRRVSGNTKLVYAAFDYLERQGLLCSDDGGKTWRITS